jgi:hypothetical protein
MVAGRFVVSDKRSDYLSRPPQAGPVYRTSETANSAAFFAVEISVEKRFREILQLDAFKDSRNGALGDALHVTHCPLSS